MKKLTIEEFIERARKAHGDKYDYTKVEYKNNKTKVCIICPIHGEFWQLPCDHLSGNGCKECGVDKRAKEKTKTLEQFITDARKIHGDKYDYSKVSYVDAHTKICIVCPIHGEFWQKPYAHLNGQDCPLCVHKSTKYTADEWIRQAKKVHGDKYDYSKVVYKGKDDKVCIVCPKHGEFWQTPHNHLNGQHCPKCKSSKLEDNVRRFLDENKIEYIFQYRNRKDLGNQTLDFYIIKKKVGIECQGIQHFEPTCFSRSVSINDFFNENKKRDNLKIDKCKKNGIKLIHYNPFEKYFGTYENEVHNIEELEKILITV